MFSRLRKQMNDKKYYHNHNKFKVALKGIRNVFVTESSFRYQLIIMVMVIIVGFILKLNISEWLIIVFASTIVFSAEVINTAIENIVDLVSPDYNALAGKIKDISAGAVLITAVGAVIIGMIIFIPKVINLL